MSVLSSVTLSICAFELGRKLTEDRMEAFTRTLYFLHPFLAG